MIFKLVTEFSYWLRKKDHAFQNNAPKKLRVKIKNKRFLVCMLIYTSEHEEFYHIKILYMQIRRRFAAHCVYRDWICIKI